MSTATLHNVKKQILIPQLRFQEFDSKWKEMKFFDLFIDIFDFRGRTPLKIGMEWGGEILSLSANNVKNGYIDVNAEGNMGSEELYQKWMGKVNLEKGDIVFTMEAPLGKAVLIPDNQKYILSQRVVAFKTIQEVSNHFLIQLIWSSQFQNTIEKQSTGTTAKGINQKSLKKIKILLPNIEEQQKIASFLIAVDEKIQQFTRKVTLLEQYKKGVMQQLFSGKLRFKDENSKDYADWEEKRLDSMISKFVVPMRDKPKELNGEIPWCRIEDFDGKYLSKSKSGQGVSIETVKDMNLKVYPIGTLLVSCSANLGFCAITETELITNQTFIGLVPDSKKVDVVYLLYVMRMLSHKLNTLSSGTTISYLSRQQFEQFKVPYPKLEEQQKIANFLSGIDSKIEKVNQQLAQTQTFKKGLLQQMFV
jgi:type I restriction enzyme S subunit